MRRSKRLIRRFAVSFLLVLMLPMIIFTLFFMDSFQETYVSRVEQQIQSELTGSAAELDRRLNNFRDIVIYNTNLPTFSSYAVRNDIAAVDIASALTSEETVNVLISKIHYYSPLQPDRVYTSAGTYTLNYYAKLTKGLASRDQLLEQWNTIESSGWLSWQNSDVNTTLEYMIVTDNNERWIFTINQTELFKILNKASTVTTLQTPTGETLYATGDQPQEESHYRLEATPQKARFVLVRTSSEDVFFSDVIQWQRQFTIIAIIVCIAGFLLVFLLTLWNEKPFLALQRFIEEKSVHLPESADEVDLFKISYENIETKVALLEQQQKKENLLLRLILDDSCDTERFKNRMQAEGLFVNAQCYRVLIAETHSEDCGLRVKQYLDMTAGDGFEFRALTSAAERKKFFIVGMTLDASAQLQQKLGKAVRIIDEDLNDHIRIFVGEQTETVRGIRQSYRDANMCSQSETEEQIVFFKKADEPAPDLQYPANELSMLYDALMEIDVEKVNILTESLITFLETHTDSKYLCSSVYYDLINTYYRAHTKLELDVDPANLDIRLLDFKEQKSTMEQAEHIRKQFLHYADSVQTAQETKDIIPRVIAYIDENITEYELSVGFIADQFDISISNLSHQFKARMNCTISGYITEKKLAYAGDRLLTTDESISSIAESLGYSQATSFIRKFKQFYGVTPTEYRNHNRKQADD